MHGMVKCPCVKILPEERLDYRSASRNKTWFDEEIRSLVGQREKCEIKTHIL
jgi:hypothetical protein